MSVMTRRLCLVSLLVACACGHEVTIGRHPSDAAVEHDAQAGSGGMGGSGGDSGEGGSGGDSGEGGSGGDSGEGGSGGHDECAEDEPVCGTDQQTYMNACLAFRAGVFISRRGPCP